MQQNKEASILPKDKFKPTQYKKGYPSIGGWFFFKWAGSFYSKVKKY
jgi:hypothetical protein